MYNKKQMPEELKQRALSMLQTEDIDTVVATLRIRKAALLKMIQNEAVDIVPLATAPIDATVPVEIVPPEGATTPTDNTAPTTANAAEKKDRKVPYYSPEFKAAALAMMEEKGAVATIRELGISSYTLYDWKSKADGQAYPRKQGPLAGKTRKLYTPEFKAEVIEYYQSHGQAAIREKYGISSNTLYTWLEEAGIERNRNRPVDHTDAIALYREKGREAVLEAYGITWQTLREWLKDAGIDTCPPKYSPVLVEKALAMVQENTLTAVAKELGIPIGTLSAWKLGKWRKG